jgi:hypothetical protein
MPLTTQDLNEIDKRIDRSVNGLEKKMDARFALVDKRFDDFDKRFDDFEKRIDKKFDDFLIKLIQHFPSRIEVKQMIEEATAPLATKESLSEVKDHLVALEEKVEIQNTFLSGRVANLEVAVFGKPMAFHDVTRKK